VKPVRSPLQYAKDPVDFGKSPFRKLHGGHVSDGRDVLKRCLPGHIEVTLRPCLVIHVGAQSNEKRALRTPEKAKFSPS
jgi:hypothetical protein